MDLRYRRFQHKLWLRQSQFACAPKMVTLTQWGLFRLFYGKGGGMKICIDPGHGGQDPGAIGFNPYYVEEKRINQAIGFELEAELEYLGHWVVMTRRKDRSLSLSARASFANRLKADFFVSLHANAAEDPQVEGMEVFHFPGAATGRRAATEVLGRMQTAFSDHRRTAKLALFTPRLR